MKHEALGNLSFGEIAKMVNKMPSRANAVILARQENEQRRANELARRKQREANLAQMKAHRVQTVNDSLKKAISMKKEHLKSGNKRGRFTIM